MIHSFGLGIRPPETLVAGRFAYYPILIYQNIVLNAKRKGPRGKPRGPRTKDPKIQVPRLLARQNRAASEPPKRTANRAGTDIPAAAARAPARAHGPEVALIILNIPNDGISISEERARLALGLMFQKLKEGSEPGKFSSCCPTRS